MDKKLRFGYFFLISILAISLDQYTKALATKYLLTGKIVDIVPNILQLLYAKNTGAAFGILQGKTILFYIIAAIVCIYILKIIYIMPNNNRYKFLLLALSFVFSGAIGNIIDRLNRGFVVDFIYFKPIDFPVFNVADIYVSLSMALLFYLLLFYYKENELDFLGSKKVKK